MRSIDYLTKPVYVGDKPNTLVAYRSNSIPEAMLYTAMAGAAVFFFVSYGLNIENGPVVIYFGIFLFIVFSGISLFLIKKSNNRMLAASQRSVEAKGKLLPVPRP